MGFLWRQKLPMSRSREVSEYASAYVAQFARLESTLYCLVAVVGSYHKTRGLDAAGSPRALRYPRPAPSSRPRHPPRRPRPSRLQPPVAPQLPSVSVASSMRLRYSSDIIWIYIIFALLLIFSSHICGFVKSPTSINGLYCKVSSETSRFVRSVMEFLVWAANRVLRRGRHMTS